MKFFSEILRLLPAKLKNHEISYLNRSPQPPDFSAGTILIKFCFARLEIKKIAPRPIFRLRINSLRSKLWQII